MSKYRIVYVEKEGYYKYFAVEKRVFFICWEHERAFDTQKEAADYIKTNSIKETRKIIKGD